MMVTLRVVDICEESKISGSKDLWISEFRIVEFSWTAGLSGHGSHIPKILKSSNPEILKLFEMFVDRAFEIFFGSEADDRLNNLSVLEQQDGRDASNLELERGIRVIVDVQLADRHFAGVIGRERVDGRAQPFAWAAPFRPEIHEHGGSRLKHR